jgi:signal transduction histidine kinase
MTVRTRLLPVDRPGTETRGPDSSLRRILFEGVARDNGGMVATTLERPLPGDGHLETARLGWDRLRHWDEDHQLWTDAALVAVILLASFALPPRFAQHQSEDIFLRLALVVPLAWRRRSPFVVFCLIAAVAFVQWLTSVPLAADLALLVALFTLAVHDTPRRALIGAGVLEVGAIMAAVRWAPAGDVAKSVLFITGLVAAALFIGMTLRTWRIYLESLLERSKRLELERDQQVQLTSAAERSRIAREMHDVVAHNVSIMVTLADGARAVSGRDPNRAGEAMAEVSEVGRLALADMRHLLGVLRTGSESTSRQPQPRLTDIPRLIQGVRTTGLGITFHEQGNCFEVPPGTGLTVYRIIQESLTNVVKHAEAASMVEIDLVYDDPFIFVTIQDNGGPVLKCSTGHGLEGMQERAAMYGGVLVAGPLPEGSGWEVKARIRADS